MCLLEVTSKLVCVASLIESLQLVRFLLTALAWGRGNAIASVRTSVCFHYKDRLSQLGLTTLETRRRRGDLIETFKIMTDRENLDKNQFFHLSTSGHGLRGHSLKLAVPRCRLDLATE